MSERKLTLQELQAQEKKTQNINGWRAIIGGTILHLVRI